MKKNYISPLAAEVNVEAEQMLAASPATLNVDSSDENAVNTANSQLDGGRRGEWGNLWK